MLAVGILIGFLVGFFCACYGVAKMKIGDLRIDNSDPEETYMFLELEKGVGDISKKRIVLLKVNPTNYISQD